MVLDHLSKPRKGNWPFDQWSHGVIGILEYYQNLTEVTDANTVIKYVRVLWYPKLKGSLLCPCASGKYLKSCCYDQVLKLRNTIDPANAKRSLKTLEALQRKLRTR